MGPSDILLDIVVPAAATTALLLPALWFSRNSRDGGATWLLTVAPLALAAGFVTRFQSITGAIPEPLPLRTPGCLFYVAIIAGIIGVFDVLLRRPWWVRLISAIIIVAGSLSVALANQLSRADARNSTLIAIVLITAIAATWWLVLQRSADKSDQIISVGSATIFSFSAAALLMMTHSFTYGRLGLAIAASTLPLILLIRRDTPRPSANSAAIVLMAVIVPLLAAGHFYSDLPLLQACLAASAPLLLSAAWLAGLQRLRGPSRIVTALIVFSVPLLIAIALSVPAFIRTLSEEPSGYEY